MFIIGDVLVFSLLFSVFVYDRSQEVALFVEQQLLLNQTLGLLNTALLLTSSWLVALAVHGARAGQLSRARSCFVSAILCGIGFVVVKYFEWGEKIAADLTIETNNFFMYYYLMTGIHLLHMVIGIGVLVFLWQSVRGAELMLKAWACSKAERVSGTSWTSCGSRFSRCCIWCGDAWPFHCNPE